jgi:hypothetical protein
MHTVQSNYSKSQIPEKTLLYKRSPFVGLGS